MASTVGFRRMDETTMSGKDLEQQGVDPIGKITFPPTQLPADAFAPGDPDDPHNWSGWRRATYTLILGYSTFALTFDSSGYSPSITEIEAAFHVGYEVAILGISLFVLAFAAGPLLWGPLSEVFGRRPVYLVSYGMFTAFSFGVAWAPNAAGLLVMRFLAAFGGAASVSNAPASGADLCTPMEMGKFGAIYGSTLFLGPALGPCLMGFVNDHAGFRWNLRIEAVVAASAWALVMVIPETHGPTLLRRRAERQRDTSDPPAPGPSLLARLRVACTLPFVMLFTEPITIAISAQMALLYGLLYGFFAAIPYAFLEVRGWTPDSLALAYLPIAIGSLVGGYILYSPGTKSAIKLAEKRVAEGKTLEPEDRLRSARFIAPFSPIGLFIFAFTSYPHVHWIGQMIGLFLFSCSMLCLFVVLIPYLIACYQRNAASALAASSFLRAAYASAFPLFVAQQCKAMGVSGAIGLYAGVSLLMTPIPFLFVSHGHKLRKRSRYASA